MQNENGPSLKEARIEVKKAPSASYSITMRVRIENKVGMIGEVISAIGRAGGDVGAIDIVQATGAHVIRDITIDAASVEHGQVIVDRADRCTSAKWTPDRATAARSRSVRLPTPITIWNASVFISSLHRATPTVCLLLDR